MIDRNEIEEIFTKTKVILKGHFLLTSGRHSDTYMQCARLFEQARYSELLCRELANEFKGDNVEIVIGPAIGGIILAYEVSRHLNVPNMFAEREDGKFKLRRGFDIYEGANALIVEDVVTTGGSVKEVIEVVKQYGGNVVGVGCIADRSDGNVDFGVKFKSVYSAGIISYESQNCPVCGTGLPLTKPGSRKIIVNDLEV